MNETKDFRVYDVMTNEEVGRYRSEYEASMNHKGEPVTIIYVPSRRKTKKK